MEFFDPIFGGGSVRNLLSASVSTFLNRTVDFTDVLFADST